MDIMMIDAEYTTTTYKKLLPHHRYIERRAQKAMRVFGESNFWMGLLPAQFKDNQYPDSAESKAMSKCLTARN